MGPAAFPGHLGQASQAGQDSPAGLPYVHGSIALEPLSLGRSDSTDRNSAGASTMASYDGRSTRSRGSGRKEADAEPSGAETSERGSGRSSLGRQGGGERARVEGCLPERTDSLFSLAATSTELPREGPWRVGVIAAAGQAWEVEDGGAAGGDGGGRGRRRSVEVVVVQVGAADAVREWDVR